MTKSNPKYQHQKTKNTIKDNALKTSKKGKSLVIPVIIAFCLPVLLYIQTINFGFTHLDDNSIILKNIPFLSNFSNTPSAFTTDAFIKNNNSPFYRPLETLSYMIDIKLSGGNHAGMYHFSNILLLGFISVLLFLLLKKFLIPTYLALLSSLIYCAHPLFVSTIAFIPNRCELQLLLFSLLSFLFLIEFFQKKKRIYIYLNWVAFTIALFCKETAALLPLLFILFDFTFTSGKHFKKKYLFIIFFYAVSGIFWLWMRTKAVGGVVSNPNDTIGIATFLSNLRTIPESLAKFFLPFDFAPIPAFSLLKTLIGLGFIAVIIIIFFKTKERKNKEKLFCLVWFFILMLPPMLYKHPLVDYFDHRFFLPLLGILLFILFIIPKGWFKKGNIKSPWLLVLIFILLSSFTYIKSRAYSDPMTFYNSVISHNPNLAMAYYNRGVIKDNTGDKQGALEDYNKAISLRPNYAEPYNNIGSLMGANMNYKEAIINFSKAIENNPTYLDAYYNRALAKNYLKDFKGAIEDCDNTLKINPNDERAIKLKSQAEQEIQELSH